MAENDLVIVLDKAKKVACNFDGKSDGVLKLLCVSMYVVGNLGFYGMILRKEGMSGKWCHLWNLSHKEFSVLAQIGECWEYDKMIELANWFALPSRTKKDPKLGIKSVPWWAFIPRDHFIVPLLHCLIGIGDNILSKFRAFVSEHVEYIASKERDTRLVGGVTEQKTERLRQERDTFDETEDGKDWKN